VKHNGRAFRAALRILIWTAIAAVAAFAVVLWLVPAEYNPALRTAFSIFGLIAILYTLYFFRDPEPGTPGDIDAIVAPAHGRVDLIDETEEREILGGKCRRISIFLSVFDVHVQRAPVAATVSYVKHTPGKYINALKAESAIHNENVLIGFDVKSPPNVRVGVRLIAGLIARRIVPWIKQGGDINKGERISLIQLGSRVDLYLPLNCQVNVDLGQRVIGGETIVARFPS
jgi:phosphatidylserine decarboxylase